MKTGRPIENPSAALRKDGAPSVQIPGPIGAHNWQPMSFDPETGLVYIPVIDGNFIYAQQPKLGYKPGAWNVTDFAQLGHYRRRHRQGPDSGAGQRLHPRVGSGGAEDGVADSDDGGWNSGMLTTAGGLLFARRIGRHLLRPTTPRPARNSGPST